MTLKKIILATSNPGKIKEFQAMLTSWQCIAQNLLHIEDAEETGLSFIENALIKARHACTLSGLPALADDSGLVVPALNGEPGIYSARYAGEHSNAYNNIQRLLTNMADLVSEQRCAYFYCALALVQYPTDPAPYIATGVFHGSIHTEMAGEGGFGYDPIFYVPPYDCTAAQLSPEVKNTVSHRAKALEQLRENLL